MGKTPGEVTWLLRGSRKRGGGLDPVTLEEARLALEEDAGDLLQELDEALERLARLDPRLGQVVEARFFGGLTESETARLLDCSERTVRRDWVRARAWLRTALTPELLDFGIARLLEVGEDGSAAPRTTTALGAMTPEYASPEQVRGDPVTTASDVYSLGVLLYRLLSGVAPYPLGVAFAGGGGAGGLRDRARDAERGQELLALALETRRELLPAGHPEVAESLHHLGMARSEQGDYEEAVELLAEALASRRRELGDDHPLVAESLQGLGEVLLAQGRGDRAEELLREALEIRERSPESGARELASALDSLGVALMNLGRHGEAAVLLEEAVRLRRRTLGESHPEVAASLNNLAVAAAYEGDFRTSEAGYRQALAIRRRALGPDHPLTAQSISNLAHAIFGRGEHAEAEALFREAVELRIRTLGESHPDVANSLHGLGLTLLAQRRPEAEATFARSLAILEGAVEEGHFALGVVRKSLSQAILRRGDEAAAELEIRAALRVLEGALPADHWRIASARSVLGACLAAGGDHVAAEPILLSSYEALRTHLGDDNHSTRSARSRLVELYEAWGRPEEAALYRR